MGNRPAQIRSTNVKRALKGVTDGGVTIARIEFEGEKFVIYPGEAATNEETPLDKWRRENGAG